MNAFIRNLSLLLTLFIGWQVGIAQPGLDRIVFSSGGNFVLDTKDSLSLSYTFGEPMTETGIGSGGSFIITQGFQQPNNDELQMVGIFTPPILEVSYEVFPNPTTGILVLQLSSTDPVDLFAGVYDLRGRITPIPEQMLGFVGSYETQFDLTPLADGLYLLQVFDESRKLVQSLKIQKVH